MVTVTGVDDNNRNDPDRRATVTHEVSGGGYDGVEVAAVTVRVTDGYTAWVRLSTDRLDVAEAGGIATYRVFLSKQPSTDVRVMPISGDRTVATVSQALTFTRNNWNIPQVVTVRAVDDNAINATNRTTTVTHRVSGGGYDGVTVTEVTVTATDNDRAGMTLSLRRFSVTEGLTRTYTVVLDSQPTAPVTVRLSSSSSNVVEVWPRQLAFTTANWNQPQNVLVTAVDDDIANVPDQRRVVITNRTTSEDDAYDGLVVTNEAVTRNDDTVGVTFLTNTLRVAEDAGTATYSLVLNSRPTHPRGVNITVTSSDGSLVPPPGVNPFIASSGWNVPYEIRVDIMDDEINNPMDRMATLTHRFSGGDYSGVTAEMTVTAIDNEGTRVRVSPTRVEVAEDSGTNDYTVTLSTPPSNGEVVTVTPRIEPTGVATVSGALTFTATDPGPKTVRVTGVPNRVDSISSRRAIITHTISSTAAGSGYDGAGVADVLVTATDNDTARVEAFLRTSSTNVNEGDTGTYTVRLSSQPTANVTVMPVSDDPTLAMLPPRPLVFTPANWAQNQTGTIITVDDDIDNPKSRFDSSNLNRHRINIRFRVSSTDRVYNTLTGTNTGGPLTISINDDDQAGLSIDAVDLDLVEADAESGTYRLQLATRPIAPVTVTPVSDDPTAVVVETGELTFTPENWNQPRTVTVRAVNNNIDNPSVDSNNPAHQVYIRHRVESNNDERYDELTQSDANSARVSIDFRLQHLEQRRPDIHRDRFRWGQHCHRPVRHHQAYDRQQRRRQLRRGRYADRGLGGCDGHRQ